MYLNEYPPPPFLSRDLHPPAQQMEACHFCEGKSPPTSSTAISMGCVVTARDEGLERAVEDLDLWDLVDRLDRPEAFDRVSLPALLRPLLLLRAFWGC